jgi:23S rRNA (pseudouridine1915-N3)-methyltransferase
MRLVIAAVGRMRKGPESELTNDYLQRAGALARQVGLHGPELKEVEAPKTLAGAKRQACEGALLLDAAPKRSVIFALDERGDALSSAELANRLAKHRDNGDPAGLFLIGGADGHDQSVRNAAHYCLSFGAATWPHMLARAMLSEQLYRAMTILSGHPYHRP